MPSFTTKGGSGSEEGGPQRTTFRPPWVKVGPGGSGPKVREGPPPIPAPPPAPWLKETPPPIPAPPSAPWLRRHDTPQVQEKPALKKQAKVVPIQIEKPNVNGKPEVKEDGAKKIGRTEEATGKLRTVPQRIAQDESKRTTRDNQEPKALPQPVKEASEQEGKRSGPPARKVSEPEWKQPPQSLRKVSEKELKQPLQPLRKVSEPESKQPPQSLRKVSEPESKQPPQSLRKVSEPESKQPPQPLRKVSEPESKQPPQSLRKVSEPESKQPPHPLRKVSEPESKKPPQSLRKVSEPEKKSAEKRAMEEKPEREEGLAPLPPPLPPPLPGTSSKPIDSKPMSSEKAAKLEALKCRPRRRPDWTDMMKEVEMGAKLKHVICNDRSAPVLPMAKAKGQFVYESEKDNVHNQLLKQIQQGVRLKKVRTNDRSKPMLQGLRKFRRQMTIEEQIQKSASVADVVAVATEPDELDDIDKVRDDLQSTKQMLALELRNKEALERENKRLMARLLNLEVELEKEKMSKHIENERGNVIQLRTAEDEKLINQFKDEANQASKMAKEMEDVYHKTAEELDVTRAKLERAWLQNTQLEMALKSLEKRGEVIPITKQQSKKSMTSIPNFSNVKPLESSSEEESDVTETETETEEEDGTQVAQQQEKRAQREFKLLVSKLRTLKEKRAMALKEKSNLKEQFSKLHKTLKEEKRKYKELQKEVDKMASLIKDVDGDEDEVYEEEVEEEEEKVEESETESESDDTDEDEESEGELPESASNEDKINNLQRRIRTNENRLTTIKKSNYLLKANIDRRQDDLNRQKEMSLSLQEDLNSVLAELG